MSDDVKYGPVPSGRWLAEHRRKLVAESERRRDERDELETAELMADMNARLERQVAEFSATACRGMLANLEACTAPVEAACGLRGDVSCPRRIREEDERRECVRLEERMAEAGVPGDHAHLVLRGLQPTSAKLEVDGWLPSKLRLLLLVGAAGTGKSVAAAYAVSCLGGSWLHADDILGLAYEGKLKKYERSRFLVVDDIGAETDKSGVARGKIMNLLRKRHDEGVWTIMTANMEAADWQTYADKPLKSRLAGSGRVAFIGGKDMRRRT